MSRKMSILGILAVFMLALLSADLAGCSVQPFADPVAEVLNHQIEKIFGTSQVENIDLKALNDQYLKTRGKSLHPKTAKKILFVELLY